MTLRVDNERLSPSGTVVWVDLYDDETLIAHNVEKCSSGLFLLAGTRNPRTLKEACLYVAKRRVKETKKAMEDAVFLLVSIESANRLDAGESK